MQAPGTVVVRYPLGDKPTVVGLAMTLGVDRALARRLVSRSCGQSRVRIQTGSSTRPSISHCDPRQRKGEQHMHDLMEIHVVGSRSDWFVLGLDKYGTVWSGTPRPVATGATFELDWV